MDNVIYVIRQTLNFLIIFMQLMLFARVIWSWFPGSQRNRIYGFIFTVTEYIIFPVRKLFEKLGIAQRGPFDMPLFVTFFLLIILQMFF